MKNKTVGYFMIIDPKKNSLRISIENEFVVEQIIKNSSNIKNNKTTKELFDEVRDYLKGGGKNVE